MCIGPSRLQEGVERRLGARRTGDHQAHKNREGVSHGCHHSTRTRGPDARGLDARGFGAEDLRGTDRRQLRRRFGGRLRHFAGRRCCAPARQVAFDRGCGFGRRQPRLGGFDGRADADFHLLRHDRPEPVETGAAVDDAGPRPQALLAAASLPEHQVGTEVPMRHGPFLLISVVGGAGVSFGFLCSGHRFSFSRRGIRASEVGDALLFLARIGQAQSALQGQGARRAMRGAGSVPPAFAGAGLDHFDRGDGAPKGANILEVTAPCGTARAFRRSTRLSSRKASFGGLFWRLRNAGVVPRHRFQVRASWDVARNGRYPASPVPVQRASRRAVMMPPGRKPRNRPGAGSRPPPAGSAPSPVPRASHANAPRWRR